MARIHLLPDQVAPVHVDAEAAAVDLRHAQENQVDKPLAEQAVLDGGGQVEQCLEGLGGKLEVRETDGVGHGWAFRCELVKSGEIP